MFAPAGTPPTSSTRSTRDVIASLREPDVQERLAALGAEPMLMTPAEFRKFMRDEMDDSAKVVKAAGIKVQ